MIAKETPLQKKKLRAMCGQWRAIYIASCFATIHQRTS